MATVRQALRFALDPTGAQRRDLARHAGTARFASNRGRARVKTALDARRAGDATARVPSAMQRHRDGNAWKTGPDGIPWWTAVSKCAPQEAFRNVERGLQAFWASRRGDRPGLRVAFPRFKKRGHCRPAFRLTGAIPLHGQAVTLPRLGPIRLHENAARWVDRITAATVGREADRWVVALAVEAERAGPATNRATDIVGVDLGVLAPAPCSDDSVVPGPKALGRGLRKLRRLSRAHSRKPRGSRRRALSARRLARHHARLAAVRRDHLQKLTTHLAHTHGRVVVEDLNVRGMLGNRRLARVLADAGFAEIRRQLVSTCGGYGSRLVVADHWFPSSKRCADCGTVRADLALAERTFHCEACGLVLDRDRNAARRLAWWAPHQTVAASAGETHNARGADVSPGMRSADRDEARTGIAPEPPA